MPHWPRLWRSWNGTSIRHASAGGGAAAAGRSAALVTLCKLRTINAVKQADFLRVPRPKLLQPRREHIELSLSRQYVVQVVKQFHRGGVVGLTFGGDKCFDLLPEFVGTPDESLKIPGAGGGLCAGELLALALGLLACRACARLRTASSGR